MLIVVIFYRVGVSSGRMRVVVGGDWRMVWAVWRICCGVRDW